MDGQNEIDFDPTGGMSLMMTGKLSMVFRSRSFKSIEQTLSRFWSPTETIVQTLLITSLQSSSNVSQGTTSFSYYFTAPCSGPGCISVQIVAQIGV
jgi:hypothetical protein